MSTAEFQLVIALTTETFRNFQKQQDFSQAPCKI